MDISYGVKVYHKLAVYSEEVFWVNQAIYFFQCLVYGVFLAVEGYDVGKFVSGIEIGHFFYRNGAYALAYFNQKGS